MKKKDTFTQYTYRVYYREMNLYGEEEYIDEYVEAPTAQAAVDRIRRQATFDSSITITEVSKVIYNWE